MPQKRFWAIYWTLFILLAALGAWFLGNLAYTVLWTALSKTGFAITEPKLATYIAANFIPFVLILIVGAILSMLVRNQLATVAAAAVESFRVREIEAHERHADELHRNTAALKQHHLLTESPLESSLMEVLKQKSRISMGLERDPNALRIAHDNTPEFEETQQRQDYIIRTVIVRVENVDQSHFISNCKVYLEVNGGNYLLLDSFTLNPTEKRPIKIATHHEAEFDKWIHLNIPVPGGFFVNRGHFRLPLSGALLTIKAICAEARPSQLICRVFVDDKVRLHMENA
jgi:hypothetical protein